MSGSLQSYKDLIVWQKSIELAQRIYELASKLPQEERYGLISQMQRAAVSIASNIAEGYARGSRRDYAQFLRIALGSNFELHTQLTISKAVYTDIEYTEVEHLADEIGKMLNTMIKQIAPLNPKR